MIYNLCVEKLHRLFRFERRGEQVAIVCGGCRRAWRAGRLNQANIDYLWIHAECHISPVARRHRAYPQSRSRTRVKSILQ